MNQSRKETVLGLNSSTLGKSKANLKNKSNNSSIADQHSSADFDNDKGFSNAIMPKSRKEIHNNPKKKELKLTIAGNYYKGFDRYMMRNYKQQNN